MPAWPGCPPRHRSRAWRYSVAGLLAVLLSLQVGLDALDGVPRPEQIAGGRMPSGRPVHASGIGHLPWRSSTTSTSSTRLAATVVEAGEQAHAPRVHARRRACQLDRLRRRDHQRPRASDFVGVMRREGLLQRVQRDTVSAAWNRGQARRRSTRDCPARRTLCSCVPPWHMRKRAAAQRRALVEARRALRGRSGGVRGPLPRSPLQRLVRQRARLRESPTEPSVRLLEQRCHARPGYEAPASSIE